MHVRSWLIAFRPKTLWASVCPVLIGTIMAWKTGALSWEVLGLTLACALLIQIGTNLANDYYDFVRGADTQERVGPTRATQAGLISPVAMKRATFLTFGLTLLIGLRLVMLGGWPILIIGILSVASGYLYTGGPWPLGYLGLGDVFVLVFFGPVAVSGVYFLHTHTWPVLVAVAGLAPGLISTAVLAVNNIRDVAQDTAAGKRTLAVRFGRDFARYEYQLCLFLAASIPLILVLWQKAHYGCLLASVGIVIMRPTLRTVATQTGPVLNDALAKTARFLLIFTILFCVGWWL